MAMTRECKWPNCGCPGRWDCDATTDLPDRASDNAAPFHCLAAFADQTGKVERCKTQCANCAAPPAGRGEGDIVKRLDGYNPPDRVVDHQRQTCVDILEAKETIIELRQRLAEMRDACHDAAEEEMGCFRAVRAERLQREAEQRAAQAEALLQGARKDAERYRWLRKAGGTMKFRYFNGAYLDEHVDAALDTRRDK